MKMSETLRTSAKVLFIALLAAAVPGPAYAGRAGLPVQDCGEARAALDRLLSSLPASCGKDSDCECYYYSLFPEDGPVALRAPGASQEQWARLDDAQRLVRGACGPELAAASEGGPVYSYTARCDSGRCVRVKSEKKGQGGVFSSVRKPLGIVVQPGKPLSPLFSWPFDLAKRFFYLVYLGFPAAAMYALAALLLCAGAYAAFSRRRPRKDGPAAPSKPAGAVQAAAPAEAQPAEERRGGAGRAILRALGVVGVLFLVLLAVIARGCYRTFGPRTFSEAELGDFCVPALEQAGFPLQPGDKILKGGKTDSWMDSSNFCLLKTSPERTLAFTAARRGPKLPPDMVGMEPLSCEYYDSKRKYPRWWRGGDKPGAACYDTLSNPKHPRGVRVVIFDSEGLVFVEQWHS